MRRRITLGLVFAVLLILIGVLVNTIVVPLTWAGAPLIFPLGIDTNVGLDTPSSDDESIHNANVDLGRLLIGGNATVYCMNDFVADPIYDSTDTSDTDTPDLALLQLAVTVPTTLPFIHGPSDNSGWIYSFADNFADNQTGSYDTAHPGQGEISAAGGAGPGPGVPNDGPSEKKGTSNSPSTGTETGTGQPDNGAYGYTPGFPSNLVLYGSLYHPFTPNGGPPIYPPNPAGTNGDHVVWLGDAPPLNTFSIASQDSGDPNSPQGNGPQGTGGNGGHHDNDGGVTPQTVQTTTFNLTDDSQSPPLTPTPEPATFTILGIGLVALGLVRRRASSIRN